MQTIIALRVIYGMKAQSWTVEVTLDDESVHRVPMSGPDQVDTLVRAFDGSAMSVFDAAADEIAFSYDPISLEDFIGPDHDQDEEPISSKSQKKGKQRR
jgi:hypothetical protein